MKTCELSFALAATLLLAAGTFTGCESTDSGSTHVTSNVYYGVGFYDPWYHGDYDHDHDVIVTPPSPGEPPGQEPRPSHPIARPPDLSSRPPSASQLPSGVSQRPTVRPMPSIPSTPRPSTGMRGGGGRGGGGRR